MALTFAVGCGTPFTAAQSQSDAGTGGSSSDASTNVGGRDAGPASNLPRDGLLLWLRADEGVTVAGGYISSWADVSGQHLDATQEQLESRPLLVASAIGDRAAVAFDGDDDFLSLPSTTADFGAGLSIFAIVNERTPESHNSVIELSNGSEVDDISFGEYEDLMAYEVSANFVQGSGMTYDTPQLIEIIHRADSTLVLRQNGQNAGADQFALPDTLPRSQNFVGRSLYGGSTTFPGLIGELLVYSRGLTDTEVPIVEAELKQRWACCTP